MYNLIKRTYVLFLKGGLCKRMDRNKSNILKNQYFDAVISSMSNYYDAKLLSILENEMRTNAESLVFLEDRQLPAINEDANEKILNIFLSKKSFEVEISTLKCYRYYIKTFFNSVNVNYNDVTDVVILKYLQSCKSHMKNTSVVNVKRVLKIFFDWLIDNDYYSGKNPCRVVNKIKCEKRIKKPLSDIEIEKLRDACINKREIAFVDLLLSTGLRREEVSNIMLTDIDFNNNEIQIFGKGAKERIVYMSTRCKLHLIDYIESRKYESPYLFYCQNNHEQKLSKNGICYLIRKIGKRAGIDNCQVHRIRKWFASDLKRKGCDITYIQKLLGHEGIQTTKTYYITVDQEMVKSEHSKYIA